MVKAKPFILEIVIALFKDAIKKYWKKLLLPAYLIKLELALLKPVSRLVKTSSIEELALLNFSIKLRAFTSLR